MVLASRFQHLAILIVVSLFCLHNLRGLIAIYPILPFIFGFIFSLFCVFFKERLKFDYIGVLFLTFFLISSFLPVFYSYLWYSEEDYIYSLQRYFFMASFFIFSAIYISSIEALRTLLFVFLIFVGLSSISILYQVFFSAILWFPEASEREGLTRFSSLMGSLTAFGIISVLAIPIALFLLSGVIRYFVIILIAAGMLVSLQKSSVMNLISIICLLFIFEGYKFKMNLIYFTLFFLLVVFMGYYFDILYIVATVDNVLRVREGAGSSDVSVIQSVLDRLWLLPSELLSVHGLEGMILGVGMVGGSGMLGFIDYPMSHNGFFDLLFIGGIFNLVSFLILFLLVFFRIRKRIFSCCFGADQFVVSKTCFYIYILFILNFTFAGALYFQPYGGVIFYGISSYFALHFRKA